MVMTVKDALAEVMADINSMSPDELRALHESSKNGPFSPIFEAFMREPKFEDWASSKGYELLKGADGKYAYTRTLYAHEGWVAAGGH